MKQAYCLPLVIHLEWLCSLRIHLMYLSYKNASGIIGLEILREQVFQRKQYNKVNHKMLGWSLPFQSEWGMGWQRSEIARLTHHQNVWNYFVWFFFLIFFKTHIPTFFLSPLPRQRKVIPPLYPVLVRRIWGATFTPGLCSTRERCTLEQVQCRVTAMMQGRVHLLYEERLREPGLPGEEQAQGDLIHVYKHQRRNDKRGRLSSVVTGEEATDTNWNPGNSFWTQENTFLLWQWPNTETGCPEWLQGLHPSRLDTVLGNLLEQGGWTRQFRDSSLAWEKRNKERWWSTPTSYILYCQKKRKCPLAHLQTQIWYWDNRTE